MKRERATVARLCCLASALIVVFGIVPHAVRGNASPGENNIHVDVDSKSRQIDPHCTGLGVCTDHGDRGFIPNEPGITDEPEYRKNVDLPFRAAAADNPRTWTLLFYDDADFPEAYDPFNAFATEAHSDVNVNVVVLRDVRNGPAWVYHVDQQHNTTILEGWREVNMAHYTTLKRFVEFGKAHYPADRYMLAMYDHGGGWLGACADMTNGGFLSMRDIARGIGEAGGVDILVFTAPCLMGAMESVYEVLNCVDVYVGSEDLSGYIYWIGIMGDICDVLNDSQALSNEDIGRRIIELVEGGPNWDYNPDNDWSTMSAMSTSGVALAVQQLEVVSEYLSVHTAMLFDDLEWSRENTWLLGSGADYNTKSVDLFDYTVRLSERVSDPFLLQSLQSLRDLLDGAIIAECNRQPSTTRCPHGLSLYFPVTPNQFEIDYSHVLDFTNDTGWDEFLSQYYLYQGKPRGNIEGSVAADCPSPDTPLEGVTVTACQAGTGDLLGAAVSGQDGSYRIPDLPADDYAVTVTPPLGYEAAAGALNVSLPGGTVGGVDVSLGCTGASGDPIGAAFWRCALRKAMSGEGRSYVDAPEICPYLDAIDAHFTSKGIDVYVPPAASTCENKLAAASDLLNPPPPVKTAGVASCHLMALLLNVAAGNIHTADVVSKDGATVSQAITHCYHLLTVRPVDALVIAVLVNNRCKVPRGMIPLSTPHIAFAPPEPPDDRPTEAPLSVCVSPNPFNPTTTISFTVPARARVTLVIYDITGRSVTTLVDRTVETGLERVVWDGRDARGNPVSSGVYFVRLEAGGEVQTRKITLLK